MRHWRHAVLVISIVALVTIAPSALACEAISGGIDCVAPDEPAPVPAPDEDGAQDDPGAEAPQDEEPAPPRAAVEPAPGEAASDPVADLLRLMNDERSRHGVPALALRKDVAELARAHSEAMAARQDIWHNDAYFTAATREQLRAKRLGENVAMNSAIDGAHARLMASPGHRQNILDGSFRIVGLGVERDSDGTLYVTQAFVEPKAAAQGTAAAAHRGPAAPVAGADAANGGAAPLAATAVTEHSPIAASSDRSPQQKAEGVVRQAGATTAPATATGELPGPAVAVALMLLTAVGAMALRQSGARLPALAAPTLRRATAVAAAFTVASTGIVIRMDAASAHERLPNKVMGFVINESLHTVASVGDEGARMRAAGANAVSITTWWVADEASSSVSRSDFTRTDRDLIATIRAAKAAGLTPVLYPLLACPLCQNAWRGSMQPHDRTAFYRSYRSMVLHYAAIANTEGVALLFIGSEMTSLQSDEGAWRDIASSVRRVYGGELAYDANWDAIGGVMFWDAVDVPSVSAYFPLTDNPKPGLAEVRASWHSSRQRLNRNHDIVGELRRLAELTGKQVLFAEAGYRSADGAATMPFDTRYSPANATLQADAYQALLETFDGQPWWRGVLWWAWTVSAAPAADNSFTPRDKPAEGVVRAWFTEGRRPRHPNDRLAPYGARVVASA